MLPGTVRDRWRSRIAPKLGRLWLAMFASLAAAVLCGKARLCAGADQPPCYSHARPAPRSDCQVEHVVYTAGRAGGQLKWLPRTTQTVTLASRPAAPAQVPSSAARAPLSPPGELPPSGQALGPAAIGPYPSSGFPRASAAQAQADPFADPFEERSSAGASGSGAPSLPSPPPLIRGEESLGSGLPGGFGAMSSEPLPAEPVPRVPGQAGQAGREPYGLPESEPMASPSGQPGRPVTAAGSGQTGYVFGPAGVKFHCPSPLDKEFYTPLENLSVDISPPEADRQPLPPECVVSEERLDAGQPRPWAPVTFTWKASGLCHKPLYFQQRHVERYGHSWGALLQPAMSHANFYASVIALPYKMGLTPPNECQYTLGFYRPNSCAPYMLDPLPLSVRAGLWEAGAWVGGAFLVP